MFCPVRVTHVFAVLYAFGTHAGTLAALAGDTASAVHGASAEIGVLGVIALLLRAYSMGAGTYTGIEAVSNGLPILREPRVRTGRRTMVLMAISLAGMVAGLLVAYLLLGVHPAEGKTLNAVLLEQLTAGWPAWLGSGFVKVALISAAAHAVCRRADGLSRWTARARQHGARPLDADAVHRAERPLRHAQRRD